VFIRVLNQRHRGGSAGTGPNERFPDVEKHTFSHAKMCALERQEPGHFPRFNTGMSTQKISRGSGIALGVVLGVIIGLLMNNLVSGLGIGVALGIAWNLARHPRV
jgi:hypothetical protein